MNKITKKSTIFLSFLLIASCLFASKPRVILNPAFEVKADGVNNIVKIEISNTSTRVYNRIRFSPHLGVSFSKSEYLKDTETGKIYNPIGIENAEFENQVVMPDSGDSTVVLIFPPLDKNVKKVDYNNQIFGISLENKRVQKKEIESIPPQITKWFDTELAKVPRQTPIDFSSDLFFKADTARLIGYLKGYDTRLGFTNGYIHASNELSREDFPIVVKIQPDGRFEAKIPSFYPKIELMNINEQLISFYSEPGQTVAMVLNWEEFLNGSRFPFSCYQLKNIEFHGPLAKINSELNAFPNNQIDYTEFQKKVETIAPVDFKKEQLLILNKKLKEAEEYIQKNEVCTQTASIFRNKMVLEYATGLFNYIDSRRDLEHKDSIYKILEFPVPDDFYDFMKKVPMNDNSLLVNQEFSEFINRLEYCRPLDSYSFKRYNQLEKTIEKILNDKNYFKSPADRELFLLFLKPARTEKEEKELEYRKDNIESLKRDFHKKLEEYHELYKNSKDYIRISTLPLTEGWNIKDSLLINKLGLSPGLISEILKIRSLKFILENLTPDLAYPFWTESKKSITIPYFLTTGERLYLEVYPEKAKTAYNLPAGKATEILRKITDPFKGKLLIIDFWATTCGPCVGAIKLTKGTREKYKDNPDLDFLFITDENSSPEHDYTKFIGEQEMKNTFRLSVDDFNYLRELFKFIGIPHYIAIDNQGRVLGNDNVMYNFEKELIKMKDNKVEIN